MCLSQEKSGLGQELVRKSGVQEKVRKAECLPLHVGYQISLSRGEESVFGVKMDLGGNLGKFGLFLIFPQNLAFLWISLSSKIYG